MRIRVINIVLYFLIKYFVFYVFLMLKNKDYSLLQISSLENGEDWFYYLWIILSLPLFFSLIFGAPLYFALNRMKANSFLFTVVASFLLEYFLYTCLASQENLWNGVYGALIGIVLFVLLFFQRVKALFWSDNHKPSF